MSIPHFYNKDLIDKYLRFKTGFSGKLLSGINKNSVNKRISINYSEDNFRIRFSNNQQPLQKRKYYKRLLIQSKNSKLSLNGLYIDSIGDRIDGSTYSLGSSEITEKYKAYFKLLIPVKNLFGFTFTIETFEFSNDSNKISWQGIKVKLPNEVIFATIEKKDSESYIIFHSDLKQTFCDFSNKAHCICAAIGYITGYYPGSEGCFFSFTNKKMEKMAGFRFEFRRKSMDSLLMPININPFTWVKNKRVADKIYKQNLLKKISTKTFSDLCKKIMEDDAFLGAILLILESSISTLIVRSAGYAVVLETLTEIITQENKEYLAPITSRSEAKKFRKELNVILNKYSENEHFKDVKTLKTRISNINQVTNKEKLKAPFKILGISLSNEDLQVIESRNDLLHGRTPDYKKLGPTRSISQKDSDLYYASLRLITLINALILKYIDFNGHILNYSKICEAATGYSCKEDFYLSI